MPYRNNFDAIRILAASMVIWGHAYAILALPGTPKFMGSSVSTLAVKMFFVLSGYLVVGSWMSDPHPLRFAIKRILRIWPTLAVVVSLAACVLGPFVTTLGVSDYFSNPAFVTYFLSLRMKIVYGLPGVFDGNLYPHAVNGSLWSLPVEVAMYLLVMALGILVIRGPQLWFSLAWVGATLVLLAMQIAVFWVGKTFLDGVVFYSTLLKAALEVAPYFMVGGCAWIWRKQIPFNPWVGVILALGGHVLGLYGWISEPVMMLFIAYAVLAIGSASTPVLKQAGRFGDVSYGLYLYGFPVAQALSWAFGRSIPLVGHIVISILIALLFALASWHFVEKKALRLKPKSSRAPAMEAVGA